MKMQCERVNKLFCGVGSLVNCLTKMSALPPSLSLSLSLSLSNPVSASYGEGKKVMGERREWKEWC